MREAAPAPADGRRRVVRIAWLALGLLLVGIGLVGTVVPLLPTTDFLILALLCFARSSTRLEAWLLNHPRLGPPLRAWRSERAIPRHAKLAAWGSMAASYAMFLVLAHPQRLVGLAVAAVLLCCALWIASRPTPRAVHET